MTAVFSPYPIGLVIVPCDDVGRFIAADGTLAILADMDDAADNLPTS